MSTKRIIRLVLAMTGVCLGGMGAMLHAQDLEPRAYFVGGRTTVDDVENDDEQEGVRIGATLALPVNRYHW